MSEKCRVANIQCSPQGDASLDEFGTNGASQRFPDDSRQGDAASDNNVCVGPDKLDCQFHQTTELKPSGRSRRVRNHWIAHKVETPDGYPRRVREAAELAKYR